MVASTPGREPLLNMPGTVAIAILVLLGIHAARLLVSDLSDLHLVLDLAFVPAQWSSLAGFVSGDEVLSAAAEGLDGERAATMTAYASFVLDRSAHPWSFLTYSLLHGSWLHVGLNSIWLAAFATPLVRRAGTQRSLIVSAAASVGGAMMHWLVDPLSVQPMIGASAVVSGLMGAAATFVFDPPGLDGRQPRPSLRRILSNRPALFFLLAWFVINIGTGLLAAPLGIVESAIAWDAHIGGLLTGLVLFPLIDPER